MASTRVAHLRQRACRARALLATRSAARSADNERDSPDDFPRRQDSEGALRAVALTTTLSRESSILRRNREIGGVRTIFQTRRRARETDSPSSRRSPMTLRARGEPQCGERRISHREIGPRRRDGQAAVGRRGDLHYLLNSNMELITITKREGERENGHGAARSRAHTYTRDDTPRTTRGRGAMHSRPIT